MGQTQTSGRIRARSVLPHKWPFDVVGLQPTRPWDADVMSVKVRKMLTDDARTFLEVHHAAVRGIAIKDYPPEIVEDWAPIPVTKSDVERFLANPDDGSLSRRDRWKNCRRGMPRRRELRVARLLCSTGCRA